MKLQPVLAETLLTLKPLNPGDFDLLFQAAADPLIWEQHPEPNRYKKEVFQKFFDSAMSSGGAFLIRRKDTGAVVGSSRYYKYDPAKKEIYVGYTFLVRDCWGGVFNRELKHLMLQHAFTFVDRVLFEIGSENKRSRAAIAKIGARFQSQHEDTSTHGYKVIKTIYSIEKDEFKGLI